MKSIIAKTEDVSEVSNVSSFLLDTINVLNLGKTYLDFLFGFISYLQYTHSTCKSVFSKIIFLLSIAVSLITELSRSEGIITTGDAKIILKK